MPGRKIRDRADAEACLAGAASSGLARAVWARNNGMDARSLNAWRLTLDREPHRGVRLVELVASTRVDPTRYVVRVGALGIEVDERFDDDVLRRLIAVAASC